MCLPFHEDTCSTQTVQSTRPDTWRHPLCPAAQVERVIAERPGESRSLLVKWEGLPYCEATWETAEDVMAAQGGPEARDDFLTRQQRMQVRLAPLHRLQRHAHCSA